MGSGPQTDKHLSQNPFAGHFFRWRHFALPSTSSTPRNRSLSVYSNLSLIFVGAIRSAQIEDISVRPPIVLRLAPVYLAFQDQLRKKNTLFAHAPSASYWKLASWDTMGEGNLMLNSSSSFS
jgi:hypothetical protein